MECDAETSHRFSRTTNAIRVTPRAKTANSYIYTLDTPSESSGEEEHGVDFEKFDSSQKSPDELCRNESSVKFQLDYEDRARKRNELVDQYQRFLKEKNSEVNSARLKQLECGLCEEQLLNLKSSESGGIRTCDLGTEGSVVIGDYLQILQKMDEEEEKKSIDTEKLNLVSTNLHRTLAEHESKLQELEKRLSELIAEKQLPCSKSLDCGISDSKPGSRMLTTNDWLSYGLSKKSLETGNHAARISEIENIEASEESRSPIPYLRNVFLSDLVRDDDGDFEARVDRQLQEYQRMAYKPRQRWSHKITIPQPFNMTIREETKPKHETFASKRFDAIKEKKEEEEKVQVRANNLPAGTMEPRFERLMQAKKQRSEQIRKESKEMLMKSERPFSFYNRSNSRISSRRHEHCLIPKDDFYL